MREGRAAGARNWSLRSVVTVALLASYVSLPPLLAIVYYRLLQVGAAGQGWAQRAEASRWLAQGLVCQGAEGSGMARADLERWRDALVRINAGAGAWLGDRELSARLAALEDGVRRALRERPEAQAPWVRGRCGEVEALAALVLERAIGLGLDPASRPDRYEDLALRDVTVYAAGWAMVAVLLLVWARRRVVAPTRQLEHVVARIADGDLDVRVPVTAEGEIRKLAEALQQAVERFDRRDTLKTHKVAEMRALVERLVEALPEPVLVAGVDGKIDFANGGAAALLEEEVDRLPGVDVGRLRGGAVWRQLIDEVRTGSDAHSQRELAAEEFGLDRLAVHCALVRDHAGEPSRVVMILRPSEGFWQRLFKAKGGEAAASS